MISFTGISFHSALVISVSFIAGFTLLAFLRTKYKEKTVITTMFWQETKGVSKPEKLFKRFSSFIPWLFMVLLSIATCLALMSPIFINEKSIKKIYILDPCLQSIPAVKHKNMFEAAINKIDLYSPLTSVIIAKNNPLLVKDSTALITKDFLRKESQNFKENSISLAIELARNLPDKDRKRIIVFSDKFCTEKNIDFCGLPTENLPYIRFEFIENYGDEIVFALRHNGLENKNIVILINAKEYTAEKQLINNHLSLYTITNFQAPKDSFIKVKTVNNKNISAQTILPAAEKRTIKYYVSSEIGDNLKKFLSMLPGFVSVTNISDAKLIFDTRNSSKANIHLVDDYPYGKQKIIIWNKEPVMVQNQDGLYLKKSLFEHKSKLLFEPDFLSFFASHLYKFSSYELPGKSYQSLLNSTSKLKILSKNDTSSLHFFHLSEFLLVFALIAGIADIALYYTQRTP